MKLFRRIPTLLLSAFCLFIAFPGSAADSSFLGSWALTLPGGHPGWLNVESSGEDLKAEMLWGWGSIFPLDSARLENGILVLKRLHEVDGKSPDGKPAKIKITETITATPDGQSLKLVT